CLTFWGGGGLVFASGREGAALACLSFTAARSSGTDESLLGAPSSPKHISSTRKGGGCRNLVQTRTKTGRANVLESESWSSSFVMQWSRMAQPALEKCSTARRTT